MAAVRLINCPPINPRASAALNGTGFYVGVDLCGSSELIMHTTTHMQIIAVVVNSRTIYMGSGYSKLERCRLLDECERYYTPRIQCTRIDPLLRMVVYMPVHACIA